MPVREMLSRMDSREITEWRAFFIVEAEMQKNAQDPPVESKMKALAGYNK